MISKAGRGRAESRQIGGGNGEIRLLHRFEREDLFEKSRLCAELLIRPGMSIGMHAHEADAEVFYMLSGALVSVNTDGSEEPFLPGDVMLTGGGDKHSLRNNTGEDAVIFAVIML